jgi:hypothetical protein
VQGESVPYPSAKVVTMNPHSNYGSDASFGALDGRDTQATLTYYGVLLPLVLLICAVLTGFFWLIFSAVQGIANMVSRPSAAVDVASGAVIASADLVHNESYLVFYIGVVLALALFLVFVYLLCTVNEDTYFGPSATYGCVVALRCR